MAGGAGAFWRDFKPKTLEIMDQKPSEITAALDEFLAPMLFPDKEDGSDPRLCPLCHNGRLSLRGGRFGAFIACSNYPDCKYTRKFGQPGGTDGDAANDGPEELGKHPETGEPILRKSGRFGPYVEMGSGKEAARASIPKDLPGGELTLDWRGQAALAPAHRRRPSRDRQADHGEPGPLWPLSRP